MDATMATGELLTIVVTVFFVQPRILQSSNKDKSFPEWGSIETLIISISNSGSMSESNSLSNSNSDYRYLLRERGSPREVRFRRHCGAFPSSWSGGVTAIT